MASEKTSNEETTERNPSCGQKTTSSFISRERRFQDALEDDEVREVLRGFHQLSEHAPVKKTMAK
jgi:hypothetical protein